MLLLGPTNVRVIPKTNYYYNIAYNMGSESVVFVFIRKKIFFFGHRIQFFHKPNKFFEFIYFFLTHVLQ